MELLAFFVVVMLGLALLVIGYDARFRRPARQRGTIGLTRIPVGILLIAVPIVWAGYQLLLAFGSLATA